MPNPVSYGSGMPPLRTRHSWDRRGCRWCPPPAPTRRQGALSIGDYGIVRPVGGCALGIPVILWKICCFEIAGFSETSVWFVGASYGSQSISNIGRNLLAFPSSEGVSMTKSERSSYTPLDFREWLDTETLEISPKFQRRGVWSRAARSYLIDTMLLGMPVPPIYLRVVQDESRTRMIREVIDGQQRISAVLDFLNGKYSLGKNIKSDCIGRHFEELTKEQKDRITQYPFICEVFYGIEDEEVLEIFARLNTHSVKLNDQELRNGSYFGEFKRSAYELAYEHLGFWRANRIFTEMRIARMLEVELTSE